jgi:GT2 family glycosyltransferase
MDELAAVVLHFRTPGKTLDCLHSLAGEGIRRVVLVDNSEDGGASLQAMQAGLASLRKPGIAIDVLDEGRNLGFAAGVNLALAHVRRQGGADVLLVNSDARLLPGGLATLIAALRSGADAVAPMLVSPGGGKHSPVAYYQKHTAVMTRRALPGSLAYVTGACLLLSRAVAEPDLFDEDFFFYGEDVMLSAKFQAQGRRWAVPENAEVLHEGAGSARKGSLFYEYHINRGHLLLARKLSPSTGRHSVVQVMFLLVRAMIRSIRSGSTVPIMGLRMAFLGRAEGQSVRPDPPDQRRA